MPDRLPHALAKKISGSRFTPVTLGESGAAVYRLDGPKRQVLYLKVSVEHDRVRHEAKALQWLGGRLHVPKALWTGRKGGRSFLLMTAAKGLPASDPAPCADPEALMALLARSLRRIHSLPVTHCPLDMRLR